MFLLTSLSTLALPQRTPEAPAAPQTPAKRKSALPETGDASSVILVSTALTSVAPWELLCFASGKEPATESSYRNYKPAPSHSGFYLCILEVVGARRSSNQKTTPSVHSLEANLSQCSYNTMAQVLNVKCTDREPVGVNKARRYPAVKRMRVLDPHHQVMSCF